MNWCMVIESNMINNKEKNIFVSVVVPVYNCENYLRKSINSLINQTIFENIEFIFVDDGSTDRSAEIINEYCQNYDNMIFIRQTNKGVAAARNRGMQEAKGEYISFFDADDIAKKNLYEKLYHLINDNSADISVVDYSMVFEDGTEKKHRGNLNKILNKNDAMKSFFSDNTICSNPVDKMFRKDIVKSCEFPYGYAIGEDMFFVYQALKKSNKIVIDSTESLYIYCIHSGSAMKKKFSDKYIDAVRLAGRILSDYPRKEKLYNYAEANYIHEICKMLGLMYQSNANISDFECVDKYKVIMNNYSIRKAHKYMSKKHLIALLLMRFSPSIYCYVYKILRIG